MPNSSNQSQQTGSNSPSPPPPGTAPAAGNPGQTPAAPTPPAKPPVPPMSAADQAKVPLVTAQTPPNKKKLVGQNYTTPDMVAKVTGQSKYAEDYRADGMLFTKLLLSHTRFQINVGGRNYAHIDPQIVVAANALYFTLLKKPQDLALQRQGHIANLVEKQGAPVGCVNAPDA